jgi:hypothetical protein
MVRAWEDKGKKEGRKNPRKGTLSVRDLQRA